MRRSQPHSRRETSSVRPRARGAALGATFAPVLVIAGVVLGILLLTQSLHTSLATDPFQTKPQGTVTNNPPTTETWTLAQGLPSQVMRLTFSAADTTRGYAAVFLDKQTQALYTTTDSGTSWHQAGTVKSPVGDIVSTDPLDPQDVVLLSVYAPTPGAYTFQRTLDGGQTWAAQTTDLPTTGMVSQTGWSDSTFLVGFQLDGQLQGSSALVAYPKGQPSTHLDVNGKIGGKAIPHLRLLTGHHAKIAVWGDDGSSAQNSIGLATTDFGGHWASLPSTILGSRLLPAAATDDGGVLLALSGDSKRVAISSDGGNTWAAQPAVPGAQQTNQGIFVTVKSKAVAISRGDGTALLHNGTWSRVTSKQAVYLSGSDAQHAARLWAYDNQGHVIWLDV